MSSGAQETLELAEVVLESSQVPSWTRVAAVLARQALEEAVRGFWVARGFEAIGMTSMRCQLICLNEFCRDTGLAKAAAHGWWALSRVCHHHPYELAPAWEEVAGWLEQVGSVVRGLALAGPVPAKARRDGRPLPPLLQVIERAEKSGNN